MSNRGTRGNITNQTEAPLTRNISTFFQTCIFIIFHARSWWVLVRSDPYVLNYRPLAHIVSLVFPPSLPPSLYLSFLCIISWFFFCQLCWRWIPLSCCPLLFFYTSLSFRTSEPSILYVPFTEITTFRASLSHGLLTVGHKRPCKGCSDCIFFP